MHAEYLKLLHWTTRESVRQKVGLKNE